MNQNNHPFYSNTENPNSLKKDFYSTEELKQFLVATPNTEIEYLTYLNILKMKKTTTAIRSLTLIDLEVLMVPFIKMPQLK